MHGVSTLKIIWWMSAACIVYAYAGYPLLVWLIGRWCKPTRATAPGAESVSIIVSAFNEELRIGARLTELTALLASTAVPGEVIAVSDGSSDGTAEAARSIQGVRVLEFSTNAGKAAALSRAVASARYDVVALADVRQTWDPQALKLLLEHFADPRVGAATGDLVLESSDGVLQGVGLYWKYEKWLRRQESRLHSTVGVTGAICAVRRSLFSPVPPGTILDDVYWPLRVAMSGFRVVHDERAKAFDRLPDKASAEFRRKVRTLSGNFQLVQRLPKACLPGCNPIWLQFLSHKLLRLVVPWAMLILLVGSALLPGWMYKGAFAAQTAFYLLALAGMANIAGPLRRFASPAASLLVLNAAAFVAFWVWVTGGAAGAWHKTQYETPVQSTAVKV